MIERYSNEEMKNIWEQTQKFSFYLDVELAVCEAQAELKNFPEENVKQIKEKAHFDIERIDEIERECHHDVIAFLTNIKESVGEENAQYIHRGLTSSDVIDTAFSLQIAKSGEIILKDFDTLLKILNKLAIEHKRTVCIGRSHGMHAELMTFGLKILNQIDILERVKKHFEDALEYARVGQISGAVGTYSNISPEVEKIVCRKLNLKPARISTQIIARDIYAYVIQSLSLIASVIEQFATEIRHLQRSEVMEVCEGFSSKQKGSSAMPHKKNPILSENLCGLARVVRANSIVALENIPLWHERDISHSSAERIIFPDSMILIDFMLKRFANLMENLQINKERMLENSKMFSDVIFSQRVMLSLIKANVENAYEIVQKLSLYAIKNHCSLKECLEKENILPKEELDKCFDVEDYLNNIEEIYKRF